MPNRSNPHLSWNARTRYWIASAAVMGVTVATAQPSPRPTAAQEPGAIEDAPELRVELSIVEKADPASLAPIPARIHLKDSSGQPVQPPGFPGWSDHFVCAGAARLHLPHGEYTFEIDRGPEYRMAKGGFAVAGAGPTQVSVTLERILDIAAEGWWSGDLHVHRSLSDAELLMRAEDLHIAQFTTWWNGVNPWQNNSLPTKRPVRVDGDRFYDQLAGEDERDGGAILYFNLDRPIEITQATRDYPSSIVFAEQARQKPGAWLEIEKPFWWDFPMWLAHGVGDSIGVAQNHLQRNGMLDNEAWGRPRDRAQFPGPHGNGRYTQELYFYALNCGFRVPPSAGSASGVLPNPVGYNRVYVHVDGALTWDKWWAGLRAGHCFVSNGPLLRARANGEWPGHVFRGAGPMEVRLEAELDSRDPVRVVELVRNGSVERIALPATLTCRESEWFLVRAIADVTNTFRFAMTAPWYVEIDGQAPRIRERSARFFLDWTRQRTAALEALTLPSAAQKSELVRPWREAELFWQGKLSESTNFRRPRDEADLRFWLENMLVSHRFTHAEVRAATGLTSDEMDRAIQRFNLAGVSAPPRAPGAPLRVLPYPGGRHPRIGFLDGAVAPQREASNKAGGEKDCGPKGCAENGLGLCCSSVTARGGDAPSSRLAPGHFGCNEPPAN